jgi:hypothetical protein
MTHYSLALAAMLGLVVAGIGLWFIYASKTTSQRIGGAVATAVLIGLFAIQYLGSMGRPRTLDLGSCAIGEIVTILGAYADEGQDTVILLTQDGLDTLTYAAPYSDKLAAFADKAQMRVAMHREPLKIMCMVKPPEPHDGSPDGNQDNESFGAWGKLAPPEQAPKNSD